MKAPDGPMGLARAKQLENADSPLTKEAARLTFRSDNHVQFPRPGGIIWSDTPLPLRLCPIDQRFWINQKRGRLTTIGYYGCHRSGNKTRQQFVAKCLCGAFQVITDIALSKPSSPYTMCCRCSYDEHVAWKMQNDPEWKGRKF